MTQQFRKFYDIDLGRSSATPPAPQLRGKENVMEMAEKQVEIEGWGKYEGTAEQVGIKNGFIAGYKYAQQFTTQPLPVKEGFTEQDIMDTLVNLGYSVPDREQFINSLKHK